MTTPQKGNFWTFVDPTERDTFINFPGDGVRTGDLCAVLSPFGLWVYKAGTPGAWIPYLQSVTIASLAVRIGPGAPFYTGNIGEIVLFDPSGGGTLAFPPTPEANDLFGISNATTVGAGISLDGGVNTITEPAIPAINPIVPFAGPLRTSVWRFDGAGRWVMERDAR